MKNSTDPLELASDLIRCPSVTPLEGGALDYLSGVLECAGFKCQRLPFSEDGTADVDNLYAKSDILIKVQPPTVPEIERLKPGTVLISFMTPHRIPEQIKKMCAGKVTSFAMELIPRISRAQSMDALSSQASVAGYKAVLVGASLTGRFFPMLTTAAGTIRPSRVLIIGVGVAGLQAIATAKRLGAIVEAYDVRAATKEQVESLGAKFLATDVAAEGSGGYARELTEEEKQQQQDMLAKHVAEADVVITTAAIPGRPSPKIISKTMVDDMKPGAIIVDLAAEGGGNCELTRPGEEVDYNNVIITGPLDIASTVAFDASETYAKNLLNLITLMVKEGELRLDWEDEVIRDTVLTHDGEIKHEPTRKLMEGEQS